MIALLSTLFLAALAAGLACEIHVSAQEQAGTLRRFVDDRRELYILAHGYQPEFP